MVFSSLVQAARAIELEFGLNVYLFAEPDAPPFLSQMHDNDKCRFLPLRREREKTTMLPQSIRAYQTLEACPEAGFRTQRRLIATTRDAGLIGARPVVVTVCDIRQVMEAPSRKGDVPQQPDVKVGIEGPLPIGPEFMIFRGPNAVHMARSQLRGKGHGEQLGVDHTAIHVPGSELMSLEREGPYPNRDE